MNNLQLGILVFSVWLFQPSITNGQQRNGKPPSARAVKRNAIRRFDFLTYDFDVGNGSCAKMLHRRIIPLRNDDLYKDPKDPDLTFGPVGQYVYGDLTGDGIEEAVVVTNCGSMHPVEQAFIFTMRNGKPVLLTRLEQGDRATGGIVSSFLCEGCSDGITIQDGLLIVERMWGRGACCPDYTETKTYRWMGRSLVQVRPPQRRKFVEKHKQP